MVHRRRVIDLRSRTTFQARPRRDAENIPLDELRGRLAEIKDEDEVLLTGLEEEQLRTAADILFGPGFKNVKEEAEGLVAYKGEFVM